jgi:hypothetical protein
MNHPKRLFDLVEAMGRRRYSDETIRLVLGGNFIRAVGRAGRSGRAQCNAAARSYRFEPRLKEAQQLRLVRKAQPAHGISGVVHLLDTLRDDIHVRLRVDAARNGEPRQFQRAGAIVSGFGVSARTDRSARTFTDGRTVCRVRYVSFDPAKPRICALPFVLAAWR